MKISIKRKAKSMWHPQWVDDIRAAAWWCAKEYDLLRKNFSVDFVLKHDPSVDYAGVALTMTPLKRFVIILNSAYAYDADHILRLVFHEMTHVKQEFHDGLVMDDTNEAHYLGMMYSFESPEHYQECYYDLPWEVEARQMEKELLEKYKNILTV